MYREKKYHEVTCTRPAKQLNGMCSFALGSYRNHDPSYLFKEEAGTEPEPEAGFKDNHACNAILIKGSKSAKLCHVSE